LAPGREEGTEIAGARAFQRELFDAGFGWVSGSVDLGGGGGTPAHQHVVMKMLAQYDVPSTQSLLIGQHIVAPAIAAYGSDEQKKHWLRALFRADVIGCQVFSEPDAGSDLASLRLRAEPDGEGWRLNGQKVWSSGAHVADIGEVLTRTEPDPALRHKGLTMFLVDMQTPGITVRPLQQMNGNAHFNEVYFDNVWVGADAMLGDRGQGWAVANASLTSERDIPTDELGLFLDPVNRLIELAQRMGANTDPVRRQELADTYIRESIRRWLPSHLAATASSAVAAVSPSLGKLHSSQAIWMIAQRAAAILGPAITAETGEWGYYTWHSLFLGAHSQRIAGGTDEIQRNIIGERGLGLPRDSR
jgi:acyl-CoA dehydrogenase